MPQATNTVLLTRTWQQVSTGTQTLTITVEDGIAILSDSTTQPAADASGHVVDIESQAWVVTPPSILWMRSAGPSASAIVSGG